MIEVFGHPEHVPVWAAAFKGEAVDWDALFEGYAATVDWPGGGVWEEISAANPDALVLLSTRNSAATWWKSASSTIFVAMGAPPAEGFGSPEWYEMAMAMMNKFTPDFMDGDAAMAAYDAHNAHVRATVPADRLVEWQPSDGWGPLCDALGVPVPAEPFPVTNTTEEFRARAGFDA